MLVFDTDAEIVILLKCLTTYRDQRVKFFLFNQKQLNRIKTSLKPSWFVFPQFKVSLWFSLVGFIFGLHASSLAAPLSLFLSLPRYYHKHF